jgi:tetratricopeptide (TPR) repeat protein
VDSAEKEDFEKLVLFLQDLDNGFAIVEINEPAREHKIIGLLKKNVSKNITEIDLSKSQYNPLEEIKKSIRENGDIEILFITNLHQSGNEKYSFSEIIRDLNFSRDLFAKLNKIFVFFIPTYFTDLIINNAQDFYDFVSFTFKFPIKDTELLKGPDPLLDDAELRHYRNRAKFLEALLNENTEKNLELVSLLRELGNAYYKIKNANKAMEYLGKAIETAGELGDKTLGAEIVNDVAHIFIDLEVGKKVLFYLEGALKVFEKNNNKEGIIKTLINFGRYYSNQGEYYKAIEYINKSLELIEETKNDKMKMISLHKLSDIYLNLNDLDKAEKFLEEAYNLGKVSNDFDSFIASIISYSLILEKRKKYDEAIKHLEYGIKVAQMGKQRMSEASLQHNLGAIYNEVKNYDKAIEALQRSLYLSDELNVTINSALFISNILFEKKEYEPAFSGLYHFLELAKKYNYKSGQSQILSNLGRKYCKLCYYKQGIQCYKKSLKLVQELKETFNEAIILYELGKVYQDIANYDKAIQNFRMALRIFNELNDKSSQLRVLEYYSRVYYDKGNYSKSIELLQSSLEIAKEMGNFKFYKNMLGNIVKCYVYLHKTSEAIKYQEELISLKEKDNDSDLEAERNVLDQLNQAKGKRKLENILIGEYTFP